MANVILQHYPLGAFPSADLAVASFETDAIFACNTLRASYAGGAVHAGFRIRVQ